jgi:phosphoribosylformylglycinamidine synthase
MSLLEMESKKTNIPATFSALSIKELRTLSAKNLWSLNEAELLTIQSHFRSLKREPTRTELETIAQSWSEHCRHKTFKSPIRYQEGNKTILIKNLFDETIGRATRQTMKPWCLSVFKDNAGIVSFGKKGKWALAFKVETHNHPCAIEPCGGAETGLGGVIRDVLAAGLGAKPVLSTDVFCVAPPGNKYALPARALTPERILRGLIQGVRDYGNRMGIPTAGGGLWFDEAYLLNPLVFVGTVGILPAWAVKKEVRPGDLIVVAGGLTGKDGLHGATFSSTSLNGAGDISAVQIGHALNEKRLMEALLRARDQRLYCSVTDCGAGGLSSAITEMAGSLGANVKLQNEALKDANIEPWEIWLSESQERMVFAVPQNKIKAFEKIFSEEGSKTRILGEFAKTGHIEVRWQDISLVNLNLKFLNEGIPLTRKNAIFSPPKAALAKNPTLKKKLPDLLTEALSHLNVCSREWVIRQYDHEVQGGTIVKPLQGARHDGPGDACVIWPQAATQDTSDFSGFAVSHGFNPSAGKIDPYRMAWLCADEALRNLLCVGADISRAAFLDNFCWGNPENPQVLGSLVRAALGCRDAAIGYDVPFISGKDSLYNEAQDASGKTLSIPGTLLISAVAPVWNIEKAITMDMKGPGNALYLAGQTTEDMGGSLYHELSGAAGGIPPRVDVRWARRNFTAIKTAIGKGLVASAHDLSEGGLIVALAEMAFSGEFGAVINLDSIPKLTPICSPETLLFSESPSRILLEVRSQDEPVFLKCVKGACVKRIGSSLANPIIKIIGLDGLVLFEESTAPFKIAWQRKVLG